MASRGVQYQLDSEQYQPLTTYNTGENNTVPYVDSCNEISHHIMIIAEWAFGNMHTDSVDNIESLPSRTGAYVLVS